MGAGVMARCEIAHHGHVGRRRLDLGGAVSGGILRPATLWVWRGRNRTASGGRRDHTRREMVRSVVLDDPGCW